MDPRIAPLTNAGMGYQPIAQGIPHHRRMPTDGLPFTQGQFGGVAAMAMTPKIYQAMGQVGMVPMGVGHDQNVYDRLRNMQYTQMQMQAMQSAAAADRQSYMQTFQGMAAMTGTPFGAQQRHAAMSLANAATHVSPFLAEAMPEFLDQMGGTRGSAVVMAKRMMDAGRYRLDPLTGRMGMSAESVGQMSAGLYGDLYGRGRAGQMNGITAGQVGSMFHELQNRGMIQTAASEGRYMGMRGDDPRASTYRAMDEMRRSSPDTLNRAATATGVDLTKPGGITGEDLDKLSLDPSVADKLRTLDMGRIKKSVKSYVGVVSAMRDIFGDMGRPNAPMAELIAGVEALTMGGMSQIDPGRMSMMVRQTYNLAKQTGVTMDSAMMMQQHAAAKAQQMGIEPQFAVQAAQGGMAFGGAYRAQGHGAHTAWGAMNADQVQQLDTNLRVQAASSNLANRMAVATRAGEQVGGFGADTDAGRYVTAIRSGLDKFQASDGSIRSVSMNDRDFTRMLTGATDRNGRAANLSEGDVQAMLGQRSTNREYVEKYGMANAVRRVQGSDELHPFIGHRMQETLTARFRDNLVRQGVAPGEAMHRAREVAGRISGKVSGRMFDMSTDEFADTTQRNQGIAGFIQEELDANGMNDVLKGLSQPERETFLNQSADRFYGSANRSIQTSMYRSHGNLQNVHRLHNRGTLDEADRQQMQARFTAETQEALAPLGRGSLLQKAVDALNNARPGDPRSGLSMVAETLGGVRIEDVNRALMPQFNKVNEKRRRVEELQKRAMASTDSTEKSQLLAQLDVARRELTAEASGLAKTGEQFGLFSGDTLTHADLSRAMGTTRGLMTAQNDIIGLRGGFGADATADQLAAVRGTPLSADDRRVIDQSRRQREVDQIRGALNTGGKLDEHQSKLLEGYAMRVKGTDAGRLMNDNQIRRIAVDMMQRDVSNIDMGALGDVRISSDEDAKAVLLNRRRGMSYRASQAEIDAVKKQFPQMSDEEAADLANTRQRARRLGLSDAAVKEHMKLTGAEGGPYGEVSAIADLFAMREAKRFEVTDADIAELTGSKGYADPDAEGIRRFRDTTGFTGDDAAVKKEMQRRMVFKGRQAAHKDRFSKFWSSVEGDAFRETTDMASQDVETVAGKLAGSPQMVQRLGTRAIEISDTLKADQQRLRELALFHTKGDLSRLMARDFGDIKADTPEEAQALADKLNGEITAIQYRRRGLFAELSEGEGLAGRRFQLGDERAARKSVLDAEVKAGRMTQADADKILASSVSPAQALNINAVRRQTGSEAAIKGILGIDPAATNLSEVQQAAVAGVRFGAGSEDEAKLMFGLDRWDQLGATGRADTLAKMRAGTKTPEEAMRLLGITTEQLKNDTTGDLAKKIDAVRAGLGSDEHARQLAPKRDGETDAEYAKRLREVKLGLFNPALAREKLGIPEDSMPAHLRSAVDKVREGVGNEAEALRLMGKKPGQALTDAEKAKLTQLTHDVGVARRIRPEDEAAIVGFEDKEARLDRMAKSRGINRADLEAKGDSFVLGADEDARRTGAAKAWGTANYAVTQLNTRAANLKSQLNALGDDLSDPVKNKKREALKAEIAKVEGEVGQQTAARTKAEDSVAADASRRNVSAGNYLKGQGWIDATGLKSFKDVAAARDADKAKVAEIAKSLGLKPEDIAGATGVTKKLQDAQAAAARKDQTDPVELSRELLSSYGFKTGDMPDDFQRGFARLLEGSAGRGMASRILETNKDLQATASRRGDGGGIDAMAKEYFKAVKSGKTADMEAFRKSHGLMNTDEYGAVTQASNEEFDRFQKSIQFQQQTGLLSVRAGKGGKGGDRSELARLYSMAMEGGEMKGPADGKGGEPGTGRVEMSGTVTLKGDQLDFAGAWGGSRNFVPPGGS